MKKIFLTIVLLVLPIAAFGYFNLKPGDPASSYRFVTVERRDLESVVAATGTLDAVTTVQVGTQVSGIVSEILVDYNDRVEAGQVIARIDPTLLEIAVREARADLERTQASLRDARADFERLRPLHEDGVVSEADFEQARYELEVAAATVGSAEVGLEKARQNLAYATIYAPISGTVVERDVDVGQTVAASLSAPELFEIAGDLSSMRILASVDESDIGLIRDGQQARFTVQAYPDLTFQGTVRQVRLQSTTQENVVNYTVVVDVDNSDGRLLPGMTATVDFLVEAATDVLSVPNAALRFRPTEEMWTEWREQQRDLDPVSGSRTGQRPGGEQPRSDVTLLWSVDEEGALTATPVSVGISNGQSTEIQSGARQPGPRAGQAIEAGMQVIAGVTSGSESGTANPFQSTQQSRRSGPPGPGF